MSAEPRALADQVRAHSAASGLNQSSIFTPGVYSLLPFGAVKAALLDLERISVLQGSLNA